MAYHKIVNTQGCRFGTGMKSVPGNTAPYHASTLAKHDQYPSVVFKPKGDKLACRRLGSFTMQPGARFYAVVTQSTRILLAFSVQIRDVLGQCYSNPNSHGTARKMPVPE